MRVWCECVCVAAVTCGFEQRLQRDGRWVETSNQLSGMQDLGASRLASVSTLTILSILICDAVTRPL